MKALVDTNILVDYLQGSDQARSELARYRKPLISRITWMEVLVGVAPGTEEEAVVRSFLNGFGVVELSETVAAAAVRLRRELRLRLPDAIILASARQEECILVTRNTKDFSADWPEVRVPYRHG